jgi:hypothetical protein
MKRKNLTILAAKIKNEAIKNHPHFEAVYVDNDYLEVSLFIYLYCNKFWLSISQKNIIEISINYLKCNFTKGHILALNELKNSLLKKSYNLIEHKQY